LSGSARGARGVCRGALAGLRVLLLAASTVALAATAGPAGRADDPALLDFTPGERAVIASMGPWPPPASSDPANRWLARPAAAAYGQRLFFDKSLSADGTVSCASCHEPRRAFQDGRRVSEARGAGLRNTPSLLDVADRRWFGWDGAHDSLWAASLAPLVDLREMASRVDQLAGQVRGDPARRAAHRAVFGEVPDDDMALAVQLAKALASYQARLRSARTSFDRFRDALVRGDLRAAARYPLPAQRGLRLFVGEGRCHVCHTGPAFTNDEFADVGVPFFVQGGVDAGRHGGLMRLAGSPMNRLGPFSDAAPAVDERAVLTRQLKVEPRHFGEFRVPSLRQVTRTAPYMHDGSLATLEDVVRHYDQLDEERLHADGERILRRLNLRPGEAADLAAFLRTLGD